MQHPNNRLVTLFKTPSLYLIAVYQIKQDDQITHITEMCVKDDPLWLATSVNFPENLNWSLTQKIPLNTPYTNMGVVFKHGNGDRCKLRTPSYEYVRRLRGNQPKLKYRYLELRKLLQVGEYLNYFPEHKDAFKLFQSNIHAFTNELYRLYVQLNIRKTIFIDDIEEKYKVSLKKLHSLYKQDLKPQNQFLSQTHVIQYVNTLHPSILMSLIR